MGSGGLVSVVGPAAVPPSPSCGLDIIFRTCRDRGSSGVPSYTEFPEEAGSTQSYVGLFDSPYLRNHRACCSLCISGPGTWFPGCGIPTIQNWDDQEHRSALTGFRVATSVGTSVFIIVFSFLSSCRAITSHHPMAVAEGSHPASPYSAAHLYSGHTGSDIMQQAGCYFNPLVYIKKMGGSLCRSICRSYYL